MIFILKTKKQERISADHKAIAVNGLHSATI